MRACQDVLTMNCWRKLKIRTIHFNFVVTEWVENEHVAKILLKVCIVKISLDDSNNHVPVSKVDIGFGLKLQLKELRSSGKINDRQEY